MFNSSNVVALAGNVLFTKLPNKKLVNVITFCSDLLKC